MKGVLLAVAQRPLPARHKDNVKRKSFRYFLPARRQRSLSLLTGCCAHSTAAGRVLFSAFSSPRPCLLRGFPTHSFPSPSFQR